jgi:hypothetical protein
MQARQLGRVGVVAALRLGLKDELHVADMSHNSKVRRFGLQPDSPHRSAWVGRTRARAPMNVLAQIWSAITERITA